MNIQKKTCSGDVVKGAGEKLGLYLFVISDGLKDRHGESINPDGWDFKEFNENPVALVGHDYGTLPIGKWLPPFVENGQVKAYLDLADTDRAEEARKLIEGGFLKTVSVGFAIEKMASDGDEYDIMAQKLYEVSLVSIPANSRAQRVKDVEALKSFEVLDEAMEQEKVKEVEEIEEQITLKQVMTALVELKAEIEALKQNKIVEEKVVEKVVTVNGDPVNKHATTLLLEIAKQNKKVSTKQDHISALLNALNQNVKTSEEGGEK